MALKKQYPSLDTFSMSSMTDVIFLLLIFFMVTSTLIFPTAIDVNLPQSSEQTSLEPTTEVYLDSLNNIYLVVNRNDSIDANTKPTPVSLNKLVASLKMIQQQDSLRAVALYADTHIEYGKVIEILDVASRNKLKMVLATRASQKIDEIYKGTDLSVGETIHIIFNRWRLNTTVEPGSVERGFVNVLKENEEYLIFLSEKVEPLYEENAPIYRLVEEGVIAPIFSYEEHENIIAELGEYEYSTYVRYEKVKDNEFFAVTEAGMETMLSLKEKMLEQYP